MLWMASSVRLLPDACKPRRDAANASMLMSPRVSKIHPAVTLGLTFALSLSLQGPASAFEETDVLIPSDAYSVDSCFGGPESKQESVCSRAAILFDVAVEEHVPKSCPEFSGPRKYICYGPCCGLPWGPGGPICLALAGIAFRYGMPYTFVRWLRSEEAELQGKNVDYGRIASQLAAGSPEEAASVLPGSPAAGDGSLRVT